MSTMSPGPGPGEPADPPGAASPGDGRPRRVLERPPSARFQPAEIGTGSAEPPSEAIIGAHTGGPRGMRSALGIAVLGAGVTALLNAVLAVTTGLVAVAGVTGYLVGVALRTNPAPGSAGGSGPRPASRTGTAIALAVGAVGLGAVGAWLLAIPQGNLLGPLDYLGQTLGPVLPVQAAAAIVGAWLGSR